MVKRGQRWRTATWLAAALLAATAASATSAATVAYFVWTPGLDGVANSALELMNPETGETRVIAEFERAAGLDASADGRRLVCRTGTWYGSRLTLIDARTGVAEHLPREHELGVYRGPKFSPDGHQVLYNYAQPAGAPFAVKVMDLGARSSTWLTPRGYRAWDPDWAPDGSQIVLVQKDPRKLYHDLHVMPAEGGDALNLTFWLEHDDEPAWSPDGKEIAFIRAHEDKGVRLAVYDMASGDVRELTDHAFEAFRPSWSPDGQHIVFYGGDVVDVDRGRDFWNVYAIRRDGTDMRRLTHYGPERAVDPVWVDADLLPVSRRGKTVTTWGRLRETAIRDQ